MSENITASILAAILCVLTRALLNVSDRKIFRREKNDFLLSMFCNAFFPLIVAYGVYLTCSDEKGAIAQFFFHPGIILSGVGAQLAAYAFSKSFKEMSVRNVVISSKLADIFIPLVIFFISGNFEFPKYFYSFASTLIFIPILQTMISNREEFFPRLTLLVLGSLLFQCVVNSYFSMYRFADTWSKFLGMMFCVLFWRSIFVSIPLLGRMLKELKSTQKKRFAPIIPLFFRAALAFISQSAFFFSITRFASEAAWPILNTAPLASIFMAHLLLNEKVGGAEIKVLGAFTALSICYVTIF